jgi:hypothetical protein
MATSASAVWPAQYHWSAGGAVSATPVQLPYRVRAAQLMGDVGVGVARCVHQRQVRLVLDARLVVPDPPGRTQRHELRFAQQRGPVGFLVHQPPPPFLGGQRVVQPASSPAWTLGASADSPARGRGIVAVNTATSRPRRGRRRSLSASPLTRWPRVAARPARPPRLGPPRPAARSVRAGGNPGCVPRPPRCLVHARAALRPRFGRDSSSSRTRATSVSLLSSRPACAARRRAWRQVKSANGAEIIGRWVHSAQTHPSGVRTNTGTGRRGRSGSPTTRAWPCYRNANAATAPGQGCRRCRLEPHRPHVRQRQPVLRTVLGDVTNLEPVQQSVSGRVQHGRQRHHAEHSRRSVRHRPA